MPLCSLQRLSKVKTRQTYEMKTNTILQGNVIDKLRELPDNSIDCAFTSLPLPPRDWLMLNVVTRIVKRFNFSQDAFSESYCFIINKRLLKFRFKAPPIQSDNLSASSSWRINRFAKFQEKCGLNLFYSQIWNDCLDEFVSFLVGQMNAEQGFAVFRRRLFNSEASSEVFVNEFNSLFLNLFDSDSFTISGVSTIFQNPYAICVSLNRKKTISVHDSCQIRQFNLFQVNHQFNVTVVRYLNVSALGG